MRCDKVFITGTKFCLITGTECTGPWESSRNCVVRNDYQDQCDEGLMVSEALFSSECTEWGTPRPLFDMLSQMFGPFTLDPCTSPDNPLGTPKFYTAKEDGLKQSWKGEIVYMNPPYGREIGTWIAKAFEESLEYARAVCLLPSRTDTKWWHNYVMFSTIVLFIKGRLKFVGAKDPAPFPSVVVVFSPKYKVSDPPLFAALEAPK